MKKKLLTLFSIATVLMGSVYGQKTAATATWSLTDPAAATPGTGQTATVTGSITGGNQTLGSSLAGISYNTGYGTTANNNVTSGWQRIGTTSNIPSPFTATSYVEYTVTPANSQFLQINTIAAEIVGGGTGSARLVAKYSVDGTTFTDITTPTNLAAYNGTTTAANEATPVVLINGGSGIPVLTGQQILTFSNLAINVNPGQTFTARFYVYLTGASTTIRHLGERTITISGVTAPSLEALPLDITSFTAKSSLSNQIKLDWKTVNEVNTKNFVVERSNGGSFSSIGSVDSKNTAGEHSYSFTDNAPLAGINYYRLLQVDHDGQSKYSTTVSAENKGGVVVSVFPSPASGSSVTVSYPSSSIDATLKVVTLGGAQVAKQTAEAGSTSSSVDVSGLAAGYYLVIYSNGKDEKSVKFVKQ